MPLPEFERRRIADLSSGKLPLAIILGLSSGGVAAARSLAHRGIRALALSSWAQPGIYTRCATVLSCPNPTSEPDRFVAYLNDISQALVQPSPVIVSEDAYVEAILNHTNSLCEKLLLPFSLKSAGITDKWVQSQAATRAGVAAPLTANLSNGLVEADDFRSLLPAIVKGRRAHLWQQKGMPKVIFCASVGQVADAMRLVRDAGVEAIIQNAVPGPPSALVSTCVFTDCHGKLLGAFCMRKLHAFPGGVGAYVRSESVPGLIEATVSLCRELNYWGMTEVEYKWDVTASKWKMIELNPRLWEQTALATAAGVDFPYIIYQAARGIPESSVDFREGVYWQDFFEDLYIARKTGQKTGRVLANFLAVSVRPHLVLSDPYPGLNRLYVRVKQLFAYRAALAR